MLVERVYSTHQTAHQGGNKTHAVQTGAVLCGTRLRRMSWCGTRPVEINTEVEITHYVDCQRCVRKLALLLKREDEQTGKR
jgi:hypothetical protein